jgi:hypothetical protein
MQMCEHQAFAFEQHNFFCEKNPPNSGTMILMERRRFSIILAPSSSNATEKSAGRFDTVNDGSSIKPITLC